jgi:ornithine decarboxylase
MIDPIFNSEFLETLPYETPFFLFSKKKILSNLQEFKDCFPGAFLRYAMKANSEPEILRVIADAGAGFEVASVYELDLLKEIGVDPKKIIYGTSIKPAADIKKFSDYGVETYAFDSLPEVGRRARSASLLPG